MQETKIILLGVQTTIAQTVLGQLEAHHYPFGRIVLMDHHQNTPQTIFYMGEEKPVLPVDLFAEKSPYIVLLCDKKIPLSYPKKKIPKRAHVIDCTAVLSKAPCFIPHINRFRPQARLICAPTSLTVILAHALTPLKKIARQFQVIALIGTSFLGQEANQKLKAQTASLFTKTPLDPLLNTPALAFNIIPEMIPPPKLTTPCQLKCITGIDMQFAHCFVPVFRGISLYLTCQLQSKINIKSLYANNPLIQYLEEPTPDFMISNRATLSENKIYLHHDQLNQNRLSFWLTGDDIQSGMALNIIHIIQHLE